MLTNVALVKEELRQNDPDQTIEDAADERTILSAIDHCVGLIETYTDESFAPYIETVSYDGYGIAEGGRLYGDELWLDRHLLALDSLTIDGTAVAASAYKLYPAGTDRQIERIVLDDNGAASWPWGKRQAISVTGQWGTRKRPAQGWVSSGDSIQDSSGIDAIMTTITVSDTAGADGQFRQPRFSQGQLIRVGSEFMQVRFVTVSDDVTPVHTLGVIRGVNGSTAAAHDESVAIDIWYAEPTIERDATRWVTLIYTRRGQFNRTQVEGVTAIDWPAAMPHDVADNIDNFRKPIFGAP